MCDVMDGLDETFKDNILGTIPASVANYADYFRMNFRETSKPKST